MGLPNRGADLLQQSRFLDGTRCPFQRLFPREAKGCRSRGSPGGEANPVGELQEEAPFLFGSRSGASRPPGDGGSCWRDPKDWFLRRLGLVSSKDAWGGFFQGWGPGASKACFFQDWGPQGSLEGPPGGGFFQDWGPQSCVEGVASSKGGDAGLVLPSCKAPLVAQCPATLPSPQSRLQQLHDAPPAAHALHLGAPAQPPRLRPKGRGQPANHSPHKMLATRHPLLWGYSSKARP